MVAVVNAAIDGGVPTRSLRRDDRRWSEWRAFCNEAAGTEPLRPDVASLADDPDGLAREQFLLAAFVIWR